MYFSEETTMELEKNFDDIHVKYLNLVQAYTIRQYEDRRAKEYVHHGFLRRVRIIVRCIHNVFELTPPRGAEPPNDEKRSDAQINIQAFVFNAFGCADNLAWVWVREKKLTKADGSLVPENWVGLRKSNSLVRGTFSTEFQEYLNRLDDWFAYLENYRHSLAHRIPLYIPPCGVSEGKRAAYEGLEAQMREALEREDFVKYDRLFAEQEALGEFNPVITHSFEERTKPILFHGQLLSDFLTIDELGRKMLEELNR